MEIDPFIQCFVPVIYLDYGWILSRVIARRSEGQTVDNDVVLVFNKHKNKLGWYRPCHQRFSVRAEKKLGVFTSIISRLFILRKNSDFRTRYIILDTNRILSHFNKFAALMARGNFCWACAMLVVQVRVSIHRTALFQTVANWHTIRVLRPGIAQVCTAVYTVITTIKVIRVLITQVFAA